MKHDHPEWRGLNINVPPRTLKSFMTNVAFPDWVWTSHPDKKFLCISYGLELAVNEIAAKRRKLLLSNWYFAHWPKVRIVEDVNLKHRWDSEQGGYMIATTPGGFASGSGGNIIIVDDIIKLAEESVYGADRPNANKYYESELFSRLNNQASDFFINISQRLHEEDFPGYLNAKEPGLWKNIVIPMECEQDTEYVFPLSGKRYLRKKGDVLLPDRHPQHWVAQNKRDPLRWAGQYQQKPMPTTGNYIDPAWWNYYESDENGKATQELPVFDAVHMSVDCAFKGTQKSDFVCLQKWGHIRAENYLLEQVCERLDAVQTEQAILDMLYHGPSGYKPDILLIEEAANGVAIIQKFQRMYLPVTLIPVNPEGGKLSRAMSVQAEAKSSYLPKTAPWLRDFKSELALGVLAAAHDDQIDAWSQAINYRRNHRWGYWEDLEHKKETVAATEPQHVKHDRPTPEAIKSEQIALAKQMVRDEFAFKLGRQGRFK
jgi:predicted phage terminase large subunit-like protein